MKDKVEDKPALKNRGKMKALCYEVASENNFPWEIHLDNAADKFLIENNRLTCSSDAWILNECGSWFNLGGYILTSYMRMEGQII